MTFRKIQAEDHGMLEMLIILLVEGHRSWGVYEERELRREVEEIRQRGEPVWPGDFKRQPVREEENRAELLRGAGKALKTDSQAWREFEQLKVALPLGDEQAAVLQRVVEENEEALRLLGEASAKKELDWGLAHRTPMFQTLQFPDLAPLRSLSRLAEAGAALATQRGEYARAVEMARQLMMLSESAEEMDSMIGHLVAMGIGALACERVVELSHELTLSKDLSRETVRKLIDELLDEKRFKEGWRRGLQFERAGLVDAAIYIGKSKVAPPPGTIHPAIGSPLKPLILRDGRYGLWHSTQMLAAVDSENYQSYLNNTRPLRKELEEIYRLKFVHLISALMMPAHDALARRHYLVLADRRMAATALAARLYALEHGRLPARLEELVQTYLPAVPDDPMSDGKKIGYVAEEGRARLYSVGENLKDDGGSERPLGGRQQQSRYQMEDLVVHLKTQK